MTYLVTGNRGFIGGCLENTLSKRGYDVVGFDMLSNYPTVEVLVDFLKTRGVKRIYHLGARAFIPDCYGEEILSVINSNTIFTANLLVAAKKVGIEKLLYFSTSEVYGSPVYIPIDEEHRVQPQSTYSATKLAAENLCRTFSKETGLDVIILRQFNVYGPGDYHPRVIPKMIMACLEKDVLKMGNKDIKRDFTYVDDAVKAAINLMNADTESCDIYNNGSGESISLENLLEVISNKCGKPDRVIWDYSPEKRPWDIMELKCNNSKYRSRFQDHNYMSLDIGLDYTIEWLRKHPYV